MLGISLIAISFLLFITEINAQQPSDVKTENAKKEVKVNIPETASELTDSLKAKSDTLKDKSEEIPITCVESMPSFPGGDIELFKYLKKNIRYPSAAQMSGIHGRVICQFLVDKDGSIKEITVIRGVDPILDAEAVRVLQSMPRWIPGKQRGKEVSVKYTLPIRF